MYYRGVHKALESSCRKVSSLKVDPIKFGAQHAMLNLKLKAVLHEPSCLILVFLFSRLDPFCACLRVPAMAHAQHCSSSVAVSPFLSSVTKFCFQVSQALQVGSTRMYLRVIVGVFHLRVRLRRLHEMETGQSGSSQGNSPS